jgi:hypothetical protein
MTDRQGRLVAALTAVDTAGAVVAARHRIAGEPFGMGRSLDVRRPAVLFFWGSGLSAPFASLLVAALLVRRSSTALRVMGAMFAFGALSEPAFWGSRPCPRHARVLLAIHVAIGLALAATAAAPDSDKSV